MVDQVSKIEITNFRSIKGTVEAHIGSPIVLVHGENGVGKTSLLSALELCLTGDVNALKNEDPSIANHLVHKGTSSASVKLFGENNNEPIAKFGIEDGGITGINWLDEQRSQFYQERCYLAQSTLGRLLQIYQFEDSDRESALTKFVHDLLGIDQLEALVHGLHNFTSHKARFKQICPSFAEQILHTKRLSNRLKAVETSIQENVRIKDDLLSKAKKIAPKELQELLEKLSSIAELNHARKRANKLLTLNEFHGLELARLKIKEISAYWMESRSEKSASKFDDVSLKAQSTQADLEAWYETKGSILNEVELFFRTHAIEHIAKLSVDPTEFLKAARTQIQNELSSKEQALGRNAQLAQQRKKWIASISKLGLSIEEVEAKIKKLEEKISPADLILSQVLGHIDSEECPVCEREFSEISEISLKSAIKDRMKKFEDVSKDRSLLEETRVKLFKQKSETEFALSTNASPLWEPERIERNKLIVRELTSLSKKISSLDVSFSEGDELRRVSIESYSNLQSFIVSSSRARNVRQQINELAKNINQEAIKNYESIDDSLKRLEDVLRKEIDRKKLLSKNLHHLPEIFRQLENVLSATYEARKIKSDTLSLKNRNDNRNKSIDRVWLDCKEIGEAAVRAKSEIISRVFGSSLNTLWADLFQRIATKETFVPSFKIPEGDRLSVKLETVHRSGVKGGSPGAMLSSGNLNTAALSLFLALHLTIETKFPWLVLDDPVQMMDENHITQFAALIRLLSKQSQRKVIISIHNRALFEYLSLELSPAFEGDTLNTIELVRQSDGNTIATTKFHVFKADGVLVA